MIVDHLCHGLTGGASIAAMRIHEGLRRRGIDSRFWHAPGLSADAPWRERSASKDAKTEHSGCAPGDVACGPLVWPPTSDAGAFERSLSRVSRAARDWQAKIRHLRNRPAGFEYFSTGQLRQATPFPAERLQGDVLVLHWIGKLLDYPTFFASLPNQRPVVWVLHDMNPFTGGCHFSSGCDRYTRGCGECPQIAGAAVHDISYQTLSMKRRLYERLNLHVVAPSQWLSVEARRSIPFAEALSHRVIPYGLETDRLRPFDRQQARRALGLDPDKPIVLFGAANTGNRRKGFHCLMEAWAHLPGGEFAGVMFGEGSAPVVAAGQAPIRHLGLISELERLRLVYSAADMFVLPSLEDNLPQTGLEAMACGTPVVAFDAGGIPDFVRPEKTGLLVPTGDSVALAAQIRRLLNDPELRWDLGMQAREMMVGEFSQSVESARYAEFLASLCPGTGERAATAWSDPSVALDHRSRSAGSSAPSVDLNPPSTDLNPASVVSTKSDSR